MNANEIIYIHRDQRTRILSIGQQMALNCEQNSSHKVKGLCMTRCETFQERKQQPDFS